MNEVPLSPAVRVQPFTGLVVDVDTWATAHEYHRRHYQLHLLTLHGSGIAQGLAVLPTEPPSDTLVVEPGVAIDDAGNVIIVPEQQRLTLESGTHTCFLILDYVESLPQPGAVNGAETRGRMVEDFRVRVTTAPPEGRALELARVQVRASDKLVVVAPASPMAPGNNEIDSRYRPTLSPRAPLQVVVGLVLSGAPEDLEPGHLRGVHNWLRELRRCGVQALLAAASGDEVPSADVIYVTGKGSVPLNAAVTKRIGEELKRGAWLFVDTCGPGVDLIEGIRGLLGSEKKKQSETEAQALDSAFVFGTAPAGAASTQEIIWAKNAIISPRDYGCAWAGGRPNQPLPREQIRSALEFGVNIAVCAASAGAGQS